MTAQLGILSRSARRALVGLCAALVIGTVFAAPASASLVINLRFTDGSTTKDISSMSAGQTVTIQVWITVNGTNTNHADDGLTASIFGVTSFNGTSNLTGNLTSGTLLAPFNDGTGAAGTFGDRTGPNPADGRQDWRGTATTGATANTGWPKASVGLSPAIALGNGTLGQAASATGWEFHVADTVFTIGSLTLPPSGVLNALQWSPQITQPTAQSGKATWREDGVDLLGSASQPTTGASVLFTLTGAGPPPAPDIDPTPTTLSFGNLLLNAALPPAQNVTLTNNGTAAGTYSTSTTGVASVASGGSGSINAGNNTPMGVALVAGTSSTYGSSAVKTGTVVVATSGDPDSAATDTVSVSVNIGEASTSGTSFGAALTGVVITSGPGANYNGLASRTTVGGGNVGSEAKLLNGTNGTGGDETVQMRWRQRTAAESTSPTSPPLPASGTGDPARLISDVVELTGLDYTGPGDAPGRADPYVLQMTYDPNQLAGGSGTEGTKALAGSIFLAWLDPNGAGPGVALWRNAIDGNFANAPGAVGNIQNTYAGAGSPTAIGTWGVDVGTHTVWAVLDHASEFAVVPEPSSIVLMGLGAMGLIWARRRRSAMA